MSAAPQWPMEGFWSLFDLSPMFHSGPEKYLDASLERCAAWFRASGASIFLFDEREQAYVLKAKTGRQSRIPKEARIVAGVGLAGGVISSGRPTLIQEEQAGTHSANAEIASSMIIPLVEPRQGVIGVLNLSRSQDELPFDAVDLEQVQAMAGQVTLAVTNARLVERLNEAVKLSRESRERLAAVLDSVPGGVIVMDGPDRVSSASPWALQEGLFQSHEAPSNLEIAIRTLAEKTLRENQAQSQTLHDETHDRTWFLHTQPMSGGGSVVSVQEITQHERSQREMHRLSRLAEIGQLTAAIAHEFRNPLTGIRSAAQVIQTSPELSEDFGKIIEEEVVKLNDLCSEFLEFARPMKLVREDALLSEPVRRVAELLQTRFDESGVSLRLDLPELEPTILMDVRRIEQVLHNLIRNSLEATPAGGEVKVMVMPWGFTVEDNGSGMDPRTQAKLFSPFFTTKAHGTGLGLSTVQKIIQGHQGTVQIESAPEKGTKITVRLREDWHG